MEFADRTMQCRDCGQAFIWTAGEQAFYQEKGLLNEPGRCPECRTARKQARLSGLPAERVQHPVVCAECGAQTTVPFVPRSGKPVYCSTCYDRVRAATSAM